MASAFKRDGIWYASCKDADGFWKSKASGTDRTAALQLASALQQAEHVGGIKPAVVTGDAPETMKATGTCDFRQLTGNPDISTKFYTQRAQKADGELGVSMAGSGGGVLGIIGAAAQQKSLVNTRDTAYSQGESFTGRSGIRTHESRICNPLH